MRGSRTNRPAVIKTIPNVITAVSAASRTWKLTRGIAIRRGCWLERRISEQQNVATPKMRNIVRNTKKLILEDSSVAAKQFQKREHLDEKVIAIRTCGQDSDDRQKADQMNGSRNELPRQIDIIERIKADIGERQRIRDRGGKPPVPTVSEHRDRPRQQAGR